MKLKNYLLLRTLLVMHANLLHQELEVQYLQSLLKISITIQVSKSQKLSLEKKMDKSDLNMSLKPIILLSLQLIFKDKKLLMKLQENN